MIHFFSSFKNTRPSGTYTLLAMPHVFSPRASCMYPFCPQVVPQLFLIHQNAVLFAVPYPTMTIEWFDRVGRQLLSLYIPVWYSWKLVGDASIVAETCPSATVSSSVVSFGAARVKPERNSFVWLLLYWQLPGMPV